MHRVDINTEVNIFYVGHASSVGIPTGYGLDGMGFESR